jgi:hypothetical protein
LKLDSKTYEFRYKQSAEAKGIPVKDNKAVKKYTRSMRGKSLSEIDAEFHSYILELLNTAREYSTPERNEIVENLAYYYRKLTDYNLSRVMLSALSDFILDDELTDRNINKVTDNDYPILSFYQMKRRNKREMAMEWNVIEYLGNIKAHDINEQKHTKPENINN